MHFFTGKIEVFENSGGHKLQELNRPKISHFSENGKGIEPQ